MNLQLTWKEIAEDIGRFTDVEQESFFNRDSGNYCYYRCKLKLELSAPIAERNVDYTEISRLFALLKSKNVISNKTDSINFIDVGNASAEIDKWDKIADQHLTDLEAPTQELMNKTEKINEMIQNENNKLPKT
jgi:hypothetical protein